MSATLDAWRRIAYHDGTGLLTIQRTVLRQMFDEMDARASRAEADADRLAAAIISTGFAAERVSMALAMLQHDEAVAQR